MQITKKTIHNNRDTKDVKKYSCVCTCCHRNNFPQYDCIIFLKQNYNFNIPAVGNALSKQYREIRQKEFIYKPCHKELKDGNYTNNIQNCPNSDMFVSNINHDQHTQDNVEQSRTHSTNTVNTVVVEALSNRYSTPTSAEYICKKCHKDLLQEIMPMNSVALCIKQTSHKPQQTFIHCNTVPTGKYLTFDKTKYGENTIVSQMTEKDKQNIICNKC